LDFAKGGKVARDLDNFYNTLRESLVWAQFHPSKRGVAQLITDLLAVREAWVEVDRADRPTAAVGAVRSSEGPESDPVRVDWKG